MLREQLADFSAFALILGNPLRDLLFGKGARLWQRTAARSETVEQEHHELLLFVWSESLGRGFNLG